MKNENYNCSITANTSAHKAFESINNVNEWWAKNVDGNSQNVDSIFTVRFGETSAVIKIVEVIPEKKILWKVMDSNLTIFKNAKDWNDTQMSWKISTEGDLTKISFTHIGLIPGKECYNDCVGGWSFFVKESLFKLLTEGKGIPGVGIRSTISNGDRTYKGTLFFKNDDLPDLPEEYILIDVNEIAGEHVVSTNSVTLLDKKTFDPQKLKGKYYMIVENKQHFKNIDALQDILKTIKPNKMKTENYNCSITANTSAQKAFEGINHVNEWWAKNLEGKTEKQNDVFTVRFGETFVTFKVTESIPGKKVMWHVTDCYLHWLKDKKEWQNTDVVFEILDKGNSTQINFTHIGLATEVECYDTCVKGWDQFVQGSLVQLLNQGKGTPQ